MRLPPFPCMNLAYLNLADPVHACDFLLRNRSIFAKVLNFLHVIFAQPAEWVRLALSFVSGGAKLPRAILKIILLSTKEQVVGVYARGIVAGMTDKEPFWYRAFEKDVRKSMRGAGFLFPVGANERELSVSSNELGRGPFPAAPLYYRYFGEKSSCPGSTITHGIPFVSTIGERYYEQII